MPTTNLSVRHIQMVLPLPNFVLYVVFEDGLCKAYGMKPIFAHPKLRPTSIPTPD